MHRPSTIRERRALLDEARAIMNREFAGELRLGDVSTRIHTSARHLQRAFADLDSTTFRSELTKIRMTRAAEMLRRDPYTSVAAVSRAVGYKQPSQFTKAFRAEHGVTPSAFRAARRTHHGYGPLS
jgi:AraC-like DNA-binding protein